MPGIFSFVTKKDERQTVEVLRTQQDPAFPSSSEVGPAISFDIVKGSLTANNKFYLSFGEKAPFNFFKCYPVDPKAKLVAAKEKEFNEDGGHLSDVYVHPVVWGVAKVTSSKVDTVHVGDEYFAMLPMGESVSFEQAHVDDEDNLVIHRPTTNPAYNVFQKIDPTSAVASKEYGDFALACSPGILTGFGLYFNLTRYDFYGADTVVVTSASSKVALALAVYLKKESKNASTKKKVQVIGYTSPGNKDFCEKTGLYDEVLCYDDLLTENDNKCVMVDISGQAQAYQRNKSCIVKNLVVGNASDTEDKKGAFGSFTAYETVTLVLTMMGANWLASWLNPVQELYLIMNDAAALKKEWGLEKYNRTVVEYGLTFCKAASAWITVRNCSTEESIEQAFVDVVRGTIPPSETIVLDVVKAVAHRKQ